MFIMSREDTSRTPSELFGQSYKIRPKKCMDELDELDKNQNNSDSDD